MVGTFSQSHTSEVFVLFDSPISRSHHRSWLFFFFFFSPAGPYLVPLSLRSTRPHWQLFYFLISGNKLYKDWKVCSTMPHVCASQREKNVTKMVVDFEVTLFFGRSRSSAFIKPGNTVVGMAIEVRRREKFEKWMVWIFRHLDMSFAGQRVISELCHVLRIFNNSKIPAKKFVFICVTRKRR